MAKVLLIKPRFLGPEFQSITHPMGLMYVGATLNQAGHDVRIHDCVRDAPDFQPLKQAIKSWQPDFIGVSIIVTELEETKRVMAIIRGTMPDVPVIFGGPWPSANPEKAITDFGADAVILGEGEFVFPELIEAMSTGRPVTSILGTASLSAGSIVKNPGKQLTEDELNALPFPAWELLDHSLYSQMPSMAGVGCRPYMTIVTSRGCPFKCAYCHQTLGKVFRRRSAESVLAEMLELRDRHGFKEFEIVDDCFNLDRDRMNLILKGIRDRLGGVKLHFPNGVRSDRLEPEDIALFRQAGTVSACFAIETSSPRIQKMIHKNLDIDKATSAIDAAVSAGIYSTGFFMLGFPTETYEEARDTVNFAAGSSLHRAIFMLTTPYAGTELADMAAAVLDGRDQAAHDMNYFTTRLNISAMSDRDLQRVFRLAYIRFYLNPGRILRLAVRHPKTLSLPRYALMALVKMLPRRKRSP